MSLVLCSGTLTLKCFVSTPPSPQPGFVSAQEYVHRLVKPSVDHVCRLKFPTGNYPPCLGDKRDLLVHWCHGSPGVIYMLLQAYRVSRLRADAAPQCHLVVDSGFNNSRTFHSFQAFSLI